MKCNQCEKEATNSGSRLCKECEREVLEEHHKAQEELMQEVYLDIIRSSH